MAYSPEEINEFKNSIIEGLINGRSLLSMEKAKEIPSRATIFNWLYPENDSFDEVFLNNYTRAREESGEYSAELVEDVALKVQSGELTPEQARVMIDAYKWTAGVRKPKKFGKTLDLTTNGKDLPSAQPTIVMQFTPPEDED